jgi:hypothetical protein
MSMQLYRRCEVTNTWSDLGQATFTLNEDSILTITPQNTATHITIPLQNSDFIFEVDDKMLEATSATADASYLLTFEDPKPLHAITERLELHEEPVHEDAFVVSESEPQEHSVSRKLLTTLDGGLVRRLVEEPVFTTLLKAIDREDGTKHADFFNENRCKYEFDCDEKRTLAEKFYKLLYLRDSVIPRVIDDPIIHVYSAAMAEVWRQLIGLGALAEKENLECASPVVKRRKISENIIEVLFNQLLVTRGIDLAFKKPHVVRQIVDQILDGDAGVKKKGLEVLYVLNGGVGNYLVGIWSDLFHLLFDEGVNTFVCELTSVLKASLDDEMARQAFYA